MSARYLLAADVGGTKAALALGVAAAARPQIVAHRDYACREYSALQTIIADFLQQPPVAEHRAAIAAACIAVAGPVASNSSTLTNLGWQISGNALWQTSHGQTHSACGNPTTSRQEISGRSSPISEPRYCPVKERGLWATSSGVPSAMIRPPPSPPSGPRSMT